MQDEQHHRATKFGSSLFARLQVLQTKQLVSHGRAWHDVAGLDRNVAGSAFARIASNC